MKVIQANLPETCDHIELHPLADLHIGDASCKYEDILAELEYIKNTPNCYCVLDGDLMDTAIKSSIGDTYNAVLQPMAQLEACVKLFAPLKDKILAVISGNHENRIYKQDGIDMTKLMCDQLGIPERYSPTTALLYIRFGHDIKHNCKIRYSLYMTHGTGGGRKEGGKIQRLADLATIVDADVYIMAHVHQPAAFRNTFFRANPNNNSVTKVEHLFINTAAWLEYGGYGDKQGFKPASTINPCIILSSNRKSMRAVI